MTATVHIDRHGYVDTVFLDTRAETLDARKYPGTLMEVTGDVAPGWRWDGQRFVLPPPRVPPPAVVDERTRRSAMFPERFLRQMTALGGANAVKVSRYLSEVNRVAESMLLGDPPGDFKDDRHWPTAPILDDMPVPVRVHESASQPITIAPVINVTSGQAEARPLLVEHRTVSEGDYGLDRSDPLYAIKVALVRTIEDTVERHGDQIPESIREAWADQLAEMAAMATAATSEADIAKERDRVVAFIEGKAA